MGSLSEQIKEPLYYYVIDKVRSIDKQNDKNAPAFNSATIKATGRKQHFTHCIYTFTPKLLQQTL